MWGSVTQVLHPDDVIRWHPDGLCLSFVIPGPWSPVSNFLWSACPPLTCDRVPGAQQLHMCGSYWHVSVWTQIPDMWHVSVRTQIPVCHVQQTKWSEQQRSFIRILTWILNTEPPCHLATVHNRQTFDCKNELAQNKTYFCNMSVCLWLVRKYTLLTLKYDFKRLPNIDPLPDPECLSRFSEFSLSPLSALGDIAAGFTSIFVSQKL